MAELPTGTPDITPTQRMAGLAALEKQAESAADLFTDPDGPPVDPNQKIRAYRGENLIKALGSPLNTPESAGGWYGYTREKAQRYPDLTDKAPSMLGGAVTRTMDVTPEEIIEGKRAALYAHAKKNLDLNLERGVDPRKAEDLYYKFLNDTDDYTTSMLEKLRTGQLPQDRFDFLLKTSMDEGNFPEGQRGKIDIAETFKRGNIGAAGGIAALRSLPYLASGLGIAAIPLDLIGSSTTTGLDPQEEVAKAYGIDPSVFYQMDPEQFGEIKQNYDMMVAKMRDQQMADAQTISPMVP